ncbi:MAG: c-type cytochrome [Bacteroidetes bacterium]|nr:c-type cytochrome [Bacteroidota bacterium]
MKKLKLLSILMVIGMMFLISCTKEGEVGPAGADGIAGTNGTNGTNGVAISAADQAAYDAASALRGGLYYNKFYVDATTGANLATVDPIVTSNADFFRCKSCHGWDLLGSNGQYISRGPTATRPNIAPNNLNVYAATHDIKQIFDAVKHSGGRQKTSTDKSLNSNMPDYSLLMTDAQVWDIVKFLKEGRINYDKMYELKTTGTYPSSTSVTDMYGNTLTGYVLNNVGNVAGTTGDAVAGKAYYDAKCAVCHGTDGKDLASFPVGLLGRTKNAEMLHIVKYGLPGKSMWSTINYNITETEMINLNKALSDTLVFPN